MLAQIPQVQGEGARRGQGAGVVVAEHPAVAGQGVLVQLAGLGVAAHVAQRPGKVVGNHQRILVVIAEPIPPLLVQAGGKDMGGAGIAAGQQVQACVVSHPAQGSAFGGGQVGGQQVRHQLRPPRPGDRIARVAGVSGGEDRLAASAGGGGLLGGEPVPQDGLGEPVQH